jgi:hypothetical protein
MGILDRLKPQPRWKHTDPAIRLDALRELNDPIELAALAETDPDTRVRRAALAKVSDAEVLGRIVATDADEETRDRAADRLVALAMAADTPEADALAAAQALTDGRRLSTIAKADAPEAIRSDALSRITEERALGSIARNAAVESTAMAALNRLTDSKELVETAINSQHKDVALAAFDRTAVTEGSDLILLRSIETRAQQKAVVKRARALIQELEAAEAARVAAEDERRRRIAAAVEMIETLREVSDAAQAEGDLARIVDTWQQLGVDDAATTTRFEDARRAAESAITARRREDEEAAERARAHAEALATADALCARVETLVGEDSLEQLAPIEEEWRSLLLTLGPGADASRLAARFDAATAGCRKRHQMFSLLSESRSKLETLVNEAETLPNEENAAAAAERWHALNRETGALLATLSEGQQPADDLADRLKVVSDSFAAREAAAREEAARAHQQRLTRLHRVVERAKRATEAESISLREGDRLMRDIGAGIQEAGAGGGKDVQELASELSALQEKLAPRVRELREMDEWRRFANAQQQEQLIAMAEAIVASLKTDMEGAKESDLIATARALRELNAKWQEVAEAPRHSAQRLWERFRTATDFIRSRCEGYFARLREERSTNLQKKATLVEEAEALGASTDWAKAAARFQQLQAEWQAIGPVPRDSARDLAHRFRTACNQFFSRRREDLTARKKAWSENLARKEALCARAEALAESTDWDNAAAEIKRLQGEWKSIGPVRRNKSEQIWARFRSAADRFFERYHNRHQIELRGKLAEREAVVIEIEALAAQEAAEAVPDLASRVQELRANWTRGVPVAASEMRTLADRWQTAFARVLERWPAAFAGTELDPAAVLQRMEKLVGRIEGLAADTREAETEGRSQTEILAARLRSALASNAMGGHVSDDAKWRTAGETVRDAQAAWLRLPPIGGHEARTLESRFREACRRVLEQVKRRSGDRRNRPTPVVA